MRTFCEFLDLHERAKRTAAKSELYPLSYGGIGNYPPGYIINTSADAFLYFDEDERLFKGNDSGPFKINQLNGDIRPHRGHGMPGDESPHPPHGMPGEERPPPELSLPGRVVPFRSWVQLVKKPTLLDPNQAPSQALHPWESGAAPRP